MAIKRDKILKTAEKLVQKGKLEQAIREYKKLLKASPEDTNTVNRLGDLYGRVGEIDEAVALYEKVAEQFAEQGFLPKAIAIYKKINRLAPQRLDIFERLGELYIEQGLMVEAKSQFLMLAEHYAKNDDTESAVRAHKRLSEIDPDDDTARLKFADLLLESGSDEAAMEAYGELGGSLIKRDRLEEAERLFRRLLDHEIPNGEVMVPVCDRLLDVGRVTSAQELLTAGLDVTPESVSLRTLQVRAFMALGETERAVELAREILEVDPTNPDVRGLVGNVLISDGDQEEAAEMMIPAAEALLEKADYSKAQKMLRELVKIVPTDERVLRLAIRAFRPSGDQEMLTQLTASLADVCFSSGQSDQAKRFYLELVASDPSNGVYRERLAQLDGVVTTVADGVEGSELDDDLPSEISFTIDADEIDEVEIDADVDEPVPITFDPTERINEAAVFAKYGLNDKAVDHLEGVIRRLPDHIGAREALAKIYLAIGQRAKATATVAPVIEGYRVSGDLDAAKELEAIYGSEPAAIDDDDDEVIIVEIDGDELSEVSFGETLDDGVLPGDVNLADMVAGAVSDLSAPESGESTSTTEVATDAMSSEVRGTGDESGPSVVAETEVVEEELVEIATGVDGPSFNELAQLDLFIEQELFEDAVGILQNLETAYPEDPDLAQRRQKLDSLGCFDVPATVETESESSSEVAPAEVTAPRSEESPAAAVAAAPPSESVRRVEQVQVPEEIFQDEGPGEYIDLAKELEEELAEEEAMVEEATGRGKGEALLDEVFKEFQRGVAEQLSDEDSDTHFNLGIAYKEMGLLEEAIGEFRVASHDPAFFVEACSMIAVCATERGSFEEAAEWYQKALVAPDLTADARTALRYELAASFEKTGEIEQAVGLFEEIRGYDPAYRDVSIRLAALTDQQRQVN